MSTFFSLAAGIGTKNSKGGWLDVYYPAPLFQPSFKMIEKIGPVVGYVGGNVVVELDNPTCHALENIFSQHGLTEQAAIMATLEDSESPKILTLLENDLAPTTTPEALSQASSDFSSLRQTSRHQPHGYFPAAAQCRLDQ